MFRVIYDCVKSVSVCMTIRNNSLCKASRGFSAIAELVILRKELVFGHPDVL